MTRPPLTVDAKIAFGIGNGVEVATSSVYFAMGMVFYNQVIGLDAALSSLAATIAIIWDGCCDPVIGMLTDCFHSEKFGRRHLFLYVSGVPVGLLLFAFFSAQSSWPEWLQFFYCTICLMALRTCVALYSVPQLALGADLVTDYQERTSIMTYNAVSGFILGPGIVCVGMAFMFEDTANGKYESGAQNPKNYPMFIMLATAVICAAAILSPVGTHRYIRYLPQATANLLELTAAERQRAPMVRALITIGKILKMFAHDIKNVFMNRSFRGLAFGFLLISINIGISETLGTISALYFWKMSMKQLSLLPLMYPVAACVVPFVLKFATPRMEKKYIAIIAVITFSLGGCLTCLLGVYGVIPTNGSSTTTACVTVAYLIGCIALITNNIMVMSMLADVAEEHLLLTGKRREAIFFSTRILCGKASSGVGHIVSGVALDLIGFKSNIQPSSVTGDLQRNLGLLIGPFNSIWAVLAIGGYLYYNITKARSAEIRKLLGGARKSQRLSCAVETQKQHTTAGEHLAFSAVIATDDNYNAMQGQEALAFGGRLTSGCPVGIKTSGESESTPLVRNSRRSVRTVEIAQNDDEVVDRVNEHRACNNRNSIVVAGVAYLIPGVGQDEDDE